MTEDERRELWRAQTDVLYRSIGEFVVVFELVCLSISLCVKATFERAGLRNQRIGDVLLAGMTAEPLRALLESLVAETAWLRPAEQDALKGLLTRFQKLASERNEVVHGMWLIQFENYASHQSDFKTATGLKFHKNKDGAATKLLERSVADLDALIGESRALRDAFNKLLGRFIFDSAGNPVVFLPNQSEG